MSGRARQKLIRTIIMVGLLGGAAWTGRLLWGTHHLGAAQSALQRRDFSAARYHLQRRAVLHSPDPGLQLLEAQTTRRLGEFEEAARLLLNCPEAPELGDERELEYRRLRVHEGDLRELDALWHDCVRQPKAAGTALSLEALIEGSLRVFEDAYEEGLTFLEGESAQALGKTQQAVEQWILQCSSEPEQTQGLVWRGRIALLQRERERAVDLLRAALARDAGHVGARLRLAGALYFYSLAEAGDHLEILRKQQLPSAKVLIPLARVRRGQGRFDEARQILDGLAALTKDDVNVLLERGNVALDAQNAQEAEPFLRRAYALAPESPHCALPLSRCLHLLDKHAEAREMQELYVRLQAQQMSATEARVRETRGSKERGAVPSDPQPPRQERAQDQVSP